MSSQTERSIVLISAGISDPSSSRMLGDRLAQATVETLSPEISAIVKVIEIRPLAADISTGIVSNIVSDDLKAAFEMLAKADGVIAVSPVYKAGLSGLFKSFMDLLDNDLLIAKPVTLAATAGSSRHASVVDEQMRPLFAYMRALSAPTSVFAAPEDWADSALNTRIDRAAVELAALVSTNVQGAIKDKAWGAYQHVDSTAQVNFETDLMKLATGGANVPKK